MASIIYLQSQVHCWKTWWSHRSLSCKGQNLSCRWWQFWSEESCTQLYFLSLSPVTLLDFPLRLRRNREQITVNNPIKFPMKDNADHLKQFSLVEWKKNWVLFKNLNLIWNFKGKKPLKQTHLRRNQDQNLTF